MRRVLPIGSRVYIGGTFTMISGVSRSRFAVVDSATAVALPWTANLDFGQVNALASGGQMIYVGGLFNSLAGVARTHLAAIQDLSITTVSVPWSRNTRPGVRLASPTPHPLRGHGTLAFDLPAPGLVTLELHDVQGRRVRTLVANELRAAGRHQVAVNSAGLPAGVYHARLRTADGQASTPVVVIGR